MVKNFSFEFISNREKLKAGIFGWSIALISIIFLSFYLSLSGSKNLASTSDTVNEMIKDDGDSMVVVMEKEYDSIVENLMMRLNIGIIITKN